MNEAIAFDTHRFVKRLTAHGFTESQAEVLADEQVNLLNGNLANKQDIAAIHQDIAAIYEKIELLRQETKKDIELLRQEIKKDIAVQIAEAKFDIIKWLIGMFGATYALLIGLLAKVLTL